MSLRDKLKDKMKGLRSDRAFGTDPRMHKARSLLGAEEYSKNADMIRDMREEFHNKKQAKKCVTKLAAQMDDKDLKQAASTLKSSGNANAAKQLDNVIGKKKKLENQENIPKNDDNNNVVTMEREQVYIPASQLSEEDLKLKKLQSNLSQKKKKPFQKISMVMPTLHDLKDIKTNEVPQQVSIPTTNHTEFKTKQLFQNTLPYKDQLTRIKTCNSINLKQLDTCLKLKLLEMGGPMIKVRKIVNFPDQQFIGLPGSEIEVDKPQNWNGQGVLCDGLYGYKISQDGKCIRSNNCIKDCISFMEKLVPLHRWLTSLEGQHIGVDALCEILNDYGVIRKQDISSTVWSFYAYCKEYNVIDDKKIRVALMPFVYLKIYE